MPLSIAETPKYLRSLQHDLVMRRVPIFWFDDVDVDEEVLYDFVAIQMAAVCGFLDVDSRSLKFQPEGQAAQSDALVAVRTVYYNSINPDKVLDLFPTSKVEV